MDKDWGHLPDLILEKIFKFLPMSDRYNASISCIKWNEAFHMAGIWSRFIVTDRTMTNSEFNYYLGWQHALDNDRAQDCLNGIGEYIRELEFRPTFSFCNLFQFITLLTWNIARDNGKKIGGQIRSIKYVFPCDVALRKDPNAIYGNCKQFMVVLQSLLTNCKNLRCLYLVDLVLERHDAKQLLDTILHAKLTTLKELHILNITRVHCPIIQMGILPYLQVLFVSPQNIDDNVLALIGQSTIRHLHLLQNENTASHRCISACSEKAWYRLKSDNPNLSVHLRVESNNQCDVLIQPNAPVASVVYRSPKAVLAPVTLLYILKMYASTLHTYGFEMLPNYSIVSGISTIRADGLFLLMAIKCPYLEKLVIREEVSTATLLILAVIGRKLRKIYVRRSTVIIRCDWVRQETWSDTFWNWLRTSSQSLRRTESMVSRYLRTPWKMLSDTEYDSLHVNL